MNSIPPLEEFLATKPLFYTKFDPNRIKIAYHLIKDKISHPKRVQLIGTNGKGSTGRAIAFLAYKSGLKVGHFSSPHIIDFKERFWLNNKFASLKELQDAHIKLYSLLKEDLAKELSYFEYQSLLAFILFEDVDLQVIEAGLGGEFDATSTASYDLQVITPISIDHKDFLGESLEEIATTKLKAIDKKALIGLQEDIVYNIATKIASLKELFFYKELFKPEKFLTIKNILPNFPNYLHQNIYLATLALELLNINYNLVDLEELKLFGRFYKLKKNITIDVGHNSLGAKAIANSLDKKVNLIFNILKDKDAKEVLKILKPKINQVEIINLNNNQRVLDKKELIKILKELKISYKEFEKIDNNKEYLVFGSFYVIEEFLKKINYKNILP